MAIWQCGDIAINLAIRIAIWGGQATHHLSGCGHRPCLCRHTQLIECTPSFHVLKLICWTRLWSFNFLLRKTLQCFLFTPGPAGHLHKTLDKMYICRFGAEPALNMGRLCLLKLILFASWFHIWSYVGPRLIGIWDLVVYGLASQALSLWLAWIWTTLSILGIIYLCPSFEQQA